MNFDRNYKIVKTDWLPSRGIPYPDDIEIYVAPMTIRERRLLEGVSNAEYFRRLLDGVQIRGNQNFDKHKLLLADAQLIDLIRRIYTFEPDRKIAINNYRCNHCGQYNVSASFMFTDLELEDFGEGVFGKDKTFTDNDTGEEITVHTEGKEYKFADGTTVYATPMTVEDYVDLATKYISNENDPNTPNQLTKTYIAQFAYLIKKIEGREFFDDQGMREYLVEYIGALYKPADEEIMNAIEVDTTSILKPLKAKCPDCGKEVEVILNPWLRFQQ